jgi:hypothetical protein
MRSLPICFLPILIAFALLLSASSPSPSPTSIDHANATQNHATASPVSTPNDQPSPKPTAAAIYNYAYTYYYPVPVPQGPPVWFQILAAAIALLFAGGLWITTIRQWRVSKNALYADRPFLMIVDRPAPMFFDPRSREDKAFVITSAKCEFKNLGKGPAIITGIVARMKLLTDLPLPPDFSDCLEIRAFKDPIVEDKALSEFFVPLDGYLLQAKDWPRVLRQEIKVGLYGMIKYEDVFKNQYMAAFGYIYEPTNSGLGGGNVFRLGRKEYNYRT